MPSTPRTARRALTSATTVLALAATLGIAGPAVHAVGASAQTHPARQRPATPDLIQRDARSGRLTRLEAARYLVWAFRAPSRVPAAYRSSTPWDGTLPLLQLRRIAARLGDGRAARAVRAAVQRLVTLPCRNASGPLPARRTTKHFYIEYAPAKLRGLKIGAYTHTLETTWGTEVTRFGWAAPPRDPVQPAPGGRYLVRIQRLGSQLYGYVTGTYYVGNNPHTPWNDKDAVASCMVLNQNFVPFPGTPLNAMRATVAHEFNHSLQFGYGALTGPTKVKAVWVEGGATWMEDEVFDATNDNYSYLWPDIRKPLPLFDPSFPYPYWVVFRAMTEPFGGSGVRSGGQRVFKYFWVQLSRNLSTNSVAFNRAFKSVGSNLATAYHDAGIALRFNLPCGANPPGTDHCLQEGAAYTSFAGANTDHANATTGTPLARSIVNDFATNWIGLPNSGPYPVTVTVTSGLGKLWVGVACRNGATLTVTDMGTATQGNPVSLTNYDPSGCNEVTAVVSNVEMTKATPTSKTASSYTVDLGP